MKLISVGQFQKLLRGYGLEGLPSVEELRFLTLKGHHESRFWNTPKETQRTTALLKAMLNGCDASEEWLLWPRSGFWPFARPLDERGVVVAGAIMKYAGFPENAGGAALFTRTELPVMIAVLFAHAAFGTNVCHDIFVIPDHAQQLLQTDHHEVVHMHCRSHQRLKSFIENMDRSG